MNDDRLYACEVPGLKRGPGHYHAYAPVNRTIGRDPSSIRNTARIMISVCIDGDRLLSKEPVHDIELGNAEILYNLYRNHQRHRELTIPVLRRNTIPKFRV